MTRGALEAAYGVRTVQALGDFLAHADMAATVVARGRDTFDEDLVVRLAAEAVVMRLGETVVRLADAFRIDHPAVPWQAIRAARNRVGHQHNAVDHALVWRALCDDIPRHAAVVRGILADESTT